MNITLRQLEIFCAIVRQNHVSRAAKELSVSQSAASMALAELERMLGEKLFDRFGKKLFLNTNGRQLFPKATDLLARANELEALFNPDQHKNRSTIKAGASSTIGNYLMPGLLGQFSETDPHSHVSLQIGNTEQIIQSLINCEIDIGFIEGPCRNPDIELQPWRGDELIVIAGPQHPLIQKSNLSLQDLIAAQWILRESGSGTRQIFEQAMGEKIQNLNIRYELGHTEAIKQAVKNQLGISCLSRLTVAEDLQNQTLLELPVPLLSLQRHLSRILRKGKYITGGLERFMQFMQTPASAAMY